MGLFSKKKDKKPFAETGFGKFASKVTGMLPELAGDVLQIATSPNPIGASVNVLKEKLLGVQENSSPEQSEKIDELIAELERDRMQWEKEIFELEVADKKSARIMYVEKSDQADNIASTVMQWNLPAIGVLLIVEILSIIYLRDEATVLAIISTAVGAVTQALITERLTVVQFFFGSSHGSKKKQQHIEDKK